MQREPVIPAACKSIQVPLLEEPYTTCHLDWAMIDVLGCKPGDAQPEKLKSILKELAEKGKEQHKQGLKGILNLLSQWCNMGSALHHDRALDYWLLEVPNALGERLQFFINDTDDTEYNNKIIYWSQPGAEPFVLTASSGDNIQLIRDLFGEIVFV